MRIQIAALELAEAIDLLDQEIRDPVRLPLVVAIEADEPWIRAEVRDRSSDRVLVG